MRKVRVKAIKMTVIPPANRQDLRRYRRDCRRARKAYFQSRRTNGG